MSVQLDAVTYPRWFTAGQLGQAFPDYPMFTDRTTTLSSAVTNHGQLTLVAGCGTGWLVKHLSDGGFTSVWGCDVSQWALTQAQGFFPALATKFVLGDALSLTSMQSVATTMGVANNRKMALCITDDLLPSAANTAEIASMLSNLRAVATTLVHVIWIPLPWDNPPIDASFNLQPLSYWQAQVGTDIIIRAQDGTRLQ